MPPASVKVGTLVYSWGWLAGRDGGNVSRERAVIVTQQVCHTELTEDLQGSRSQHQVARLWQALAAGLAGQA